MRTLLAFIVAAFTTLPCVAQLSTTDKSAKGTFYLSVDDAVSIFINGAPVYKTGRGESRSPELALKTGDRLVVQLRNDGDKRYFMLAFVSSDRQTVVSFRNRDFKIVPDIDVTDFAPDQFQKWNKFAKEDKRKPVLPIKSYSEWVWGDLDKCILACTITPQMFSQKSH